MKIIKAIIFSFVAMAITASGQDVLKLKSQASAMKCKVIEITDSLIVYGRTGSDQVLISAISDIDWYILKNGSGTNLSGAEIKESDLENAIMGTPVPTKNSEDLIKLRNSNDILKCYIIQEQDSSIAYERLDTHAIAVAKLSDIDYYILRTGRIKRINNAETPSPEVQVSPKHSSNIEPLLQSPQASASANPDKRVSLTIFGNRLSLSGTYNSLYDELYFDPWGNLQIRTIELSLKREITDFNLGASLLIPASDDVSLIINFLYSSPKKHSPADSRFYSFDEKFTGTSFGAGIKIYLTR